MYVVLAILFGQIDPVLRQPVPVWNPFEWNTIQFRYVLEHIFGERGYFGPALLRTAVYVGVASVLCLLIAYPVAYYTARFAGRWKGVLLALLIAPFWISYMMRMLAWVNLLQNDGLVNKALSLGGALRHPASTGSSGHGSTVILGLVYGYVPYMILPLFAGLDRIPRLDARGGPRPRRQPVRHVPAGHLADEPAGGHDQRAADLPADARRLLHQRPALGLAEHVDGRQPDQQLGAHARPDRPGAARSCCSCCSCRSCRWSSTCGPPRARTCGYDDLTAARRRQPSMQRRGRLAVGTQPVAQAARCWPAFTARLHRLVAAAGADRGRCSRSTPAARAPSWQGFSFRWYCGDPLRSVWHDATLHTALIHTLRLGVITTVITVPLGRDARPRPRPLARPAAVGRQLRDAAVVRLPETLLAVALLFVVTKIPGTPLSLGTERPGGRAGHLPAVLPGDHRARPAAHDRQAVRGGRGRPRRLAAGAVRRVLLPMLYPAIFASTVLVFADVVDDFVIVRYLSGDASTEPVSVKIYNTARAAPTPALNALATLILLASFLAIVIGYLIYRRLNSDDKSSGVGGFAGEL